MNRCPIFVAHVQDPPNGSFSQLHNAEREPLRPVALKVLETRPEALRMAVEKLKWKIYLAILQSEPPKHCQENS